MRLHRRDTLALLAAASLSAWPARAAETLTIQAVNGPLAYFAARLAGDAAEVVMPAPEGRDPAVWRPSIAEVAAIQAADLILLNGAGYAQWTAKVSLPRSRTVDTSRGFADRLIPAEGVVHSHGADGEHSHAGTASITWLDFDQAAAQARAVAEALSQRLPDRADAIAAELTGLETDLADLHAEARRIGAAAAGRRIIASHPRYQYLARAYGFDIASLDWDASAVPDAAQWTEFDALKGDAAPVVMLWEAAPAAETEARLQADGVTIVVFPTLADSRPGDDFVAAMRDSLGRLDAALAQ